MKSNNSIKCSEISDGQYTVSIDLRGIHNSDKLKDFKKRLKSFPMIAMVIPAESTNSMAINSVTNPRRYFRWKDGMGDVRAECVLPMQPLHERPPLILQT